jgi:hypothetical protein
MVSGVSAAEAGADAGDGVPPERLKRPARKPLSQARCSGLKGAVSGREGTDMTEMTNDQCPMTDEIADVWRGLAGWF